MTAHVFVCCYQLNSIVWDLLGSGLYGMLYVGRQYPATDNRLCMHRFAGPIRVIELLAMFDEMHPSINNAGCRQSCKVPSSSLLSVYCPSM